MISMSPKWLRIAALSHRHLLWNILGNLKWRCRVPILSSIYTKYKEAFARCFFHVSEWSLAFANGTVRNFVRNEIPNNLLDYWTRKRNGNDVRSPSLARCPFRFRSPSFGKRVYISRQEKILHLQALPWMHGPRCYSYETRLNTQARIVLRPGETAWSKVRTFCQYIFFKLAPLVFQVSIYSFIHHWNEGLSGMGYRPSRGRRELSGGGVKSLSLDSRKDFPVGTSWAEERLTIQSILVISSDRFL